MGGSTVEVSGCEVELELGSGRRSRTDEAMEVVGEEVGGKDVATHLDAPRNESTFPLRSIDGPSLKQPHGLCGVTEQGDRHRCHR